MIATVSDPPTLPAPRSRRFSRTLIALVATAVVLVGGGVITAFAVSFHYLHATALDCVCSVGWMPGEPHPHWVQALSESDSIVDNSPSHRHAFYVMVANDSAVTQTIVGTTLENAHIEVGVETNFSDYDPTTMHFVSTPVALHPGDVRYLLVKWAVCAPIGGYTAIDSLELRLRVGAFTRTERVSFGNFELGIVGKRLGCA
jgi:hypothetical protein